MKCPPPSCREHVVGPFVSWLRRQQPQCGLADCAYLRTTLGVAEGKELQPRLHRMR